MVRARHQCTDTGKREIYTKYIDDIKFVLVWVRIDNPDQMTFIEESHKTDGKHVNAVYKSINVVINHVHAMLPWWCLLILTVAVPLLLMFTSFFAYIYTHCVMSLILAYTPGTYWSNVIVMGCFQGSLLPSPLPESRETERGTAGL